MFIDGLHLEQQVIKDINNLELLIKQIYNILTSKIFNMKISFDKLFKIISELNYNNSDNQNDENDIFIILQKEL